MLEQLTRVSRVVRLRHLFKLLRHPREEIAAFKYHYRRVPERAFVAFLAGIPRGEAATIDRVYADLHDHAARFAALTARLAVHPDGFGGQMMSEYSAIYALIRLLRPATVVETGVADGATSAYILQALEDNGRGHLHSIDLPSERLPPGAAPGWIVDASLRHRWTLRIGASGQLLEPLLSELDSIDVFLHDSLHTYGSSSTAWHGRSCMATGSSCRTTSAATPRSSTLLARSACAGVIGVSTRSSVASGRAGSGVSPATAPGARSGRRRRRAW